MNIFVGEKKFKSNNKILTEKNKNNRFSENVIVMENRSHVERQRVFGAFFFYLRGRCGTLLPLINL